MPHAFNYIVDSTLGICLQSVASSEFISFPLYNGVCGARTLIVHVFKVFLNHLYVIL